MKEERIKEIAWQYGSTTNPDIEGAVKQALKEERERIIKMIEEEARRFPLDRIRLEIFHDIANKLREDK